MNETLLDLLYRSFDDKLSKQEEQELQKALASSPKLREEKKRIEEMRRVVAKSTERSFKPFFSARVMQRIKAETAEQEDFFGSLLWVFRRITVAGALAIVLLIANNVFTGGSFSLEKVIGIPQLTLEDTWQLQTPLEEVVQ